MTLYHVGTEDIHFVQAGGAAVSTNSGRFRSEWARCALVAGGGRFWRGPLQHMSVSIDEFWFTCRLNQLTRGATPDWLRFLNGGTWRLAVYGGYGEYPSLYRHNDDDTTDLLATGELPMFTQSVLGLVNIHVNLSDGKFRLYLDRELAINFTGDLTNGGEYSAITGYDLYGGTSGGTVVYYSEVCWRSDDTRKMLGVRAIWPDGDGVNMDWTGTIADVDEIAVDENDANYTDTPDLVQEYTVPPLPLLTGNVIVGGVMVGARMATNPTDEAVVVRTGGSDYLSASYDTGGAIEDRMNIWETSPDTSDPFTQDEVNDPDFNIGVAST